MTLLTPVILSGGSGTRLWPLSRSAKPKQFHALVGDKSLVAQALERVAGLEDARPPVIICGASQWPLVQASRDEAGERLSGVLLEPMPRNTGPAIAAAALLLKQTGDAPMLVCPADHFIGDTHAFGDAVKKAVHLAQGGRLVTFGIRPDRPETGYGYIRRGAARGSGFDVAAFVEKPDLETALTYLASGDYDWNAGIFCFRPSVFLEELGAYQPDMLEAAHRAVSGLSLSPDAPAHLDAGAFGEAPSISVDYAVMEHTDHASVIPVSMGWSDVGSWQALWEHGTKDPAGNVTHGDALFAKTKDCYVRAQTRTVALAGVEGVSVIDLPDTVLVLKHDDAEAMQALVAHLKALRPDLLKG